MKKRILLIGYNYYPELTGIGKYSGEMIVWLAEQGYDCTVITSYPYYPDWKVQEPYFKDRFRFKKEQVNFKSGGKINVYRCPMYVPEKPSGLKRMLLDFTFMVAAFFKLTQLLFGRKFNFIITIAPSFMYGYLGLFYKKLRGGKVLYHIHDMQIEAARDLQMVKSERVTNTLFRIEKYILDQVDIVSCVSSAMILRIEKKAKRPIYLFENWTDTNKFYPIRDKSKLKEEFGFNAADKIILYSGAVGEKQGLEAILNAAKELEQNRQLKFVICGTGPYKENLQQLAKKLNLQNFYFLPLQPYNKFNEFLNMADLHLVIQKANAGDLMMPSKLTTILAVGGLALVTANENSGLYNLITQYEMGIVVEAESQHALNEGIRKAVAEDNTLKLRNARSYAENHLSINHIMTQFESRVMGHVRQLA